MLAAVLASFFLLSNAHATSPHETFFSVDVPRPDQIREWSALPGKRSYVIQTRDPAREELKPLANLRGADRIQIEVARFPNEDALPVWKELAAQGIELVGYKAGMPMDDEIRRMNDAGFSRILIAVDYFPDVNDGARLGKFKGNVAVTFATRFYPTFKDKPGLIAIPPGIPLAFASDYWPSYVHMDLFNMLPNPRRLRVFGMMPPEDSLQYLRGIQKLENITVDTEYEPATSDWRNFEGLPVTWSCRGLVPSTESLQAFAASGQGIQSRALVVDRDLPLTSEELARLTNSPLPVEWVHAPPFSRSAR